MHITSVQPNDKPAIELENIAEQFKKSAYFSVPRHSLVNLEVIPLELINSNRDTIRKARGGQLISRANKLEPNGK